LAFVCGTRNTTTNGGHARGRTDSSDDQSFHNTVCFFCFLVVAGFDSVAERLRYSTQPGFPVAQTNVLARRRVHSTPSFKILAAEFRRKWEEVCAATKTADATDYTDDTDEGGPV
jgi:hypothetical protein